MKLNFVRKELKEFINNEIKPIYKTFDKAHSISHFNFVTKNCVDYGSELIKKGIEVNLEIAYVVGALHDIGISKGREGHAKSSGEIVRNHKKLKEFYSEEEITWSCSLEHWANAGCMCIFVMAGTTTG